MLGISGGKAIFCGCISSFLMELCQLLLTIGVCDITDLLTNTIGTAVGVGLYGLIRGICPDKQKRDSMINTLATIALLLFFALVLLLVTAN